MKLAALCGALALALCVSACNTPLGQAVSGAVSANAPAIATAACKQFTKSAAADQLCLTDAGLAISVGQAIQQGLVKN